jgi:shikimate kinase / 3-dehydroquinate synthase
MYVANMEKGTIEKGNAQKTNVILTGFMGTGKTTVGKLLAQQLGYAFVDTDALIQERMGKTIPEIFEERGEAAFRRLEAELALELANRQGLVISTGGRLMLDPDNAAALTRTGRVFCLVATPEEILARVTRDAGTERPLLATADPLKRIVDLMQERREDYGRFAQMTTSRKSPDIVSKNLIGILQANPDLRVPITASMTTYEFIVGAGILPFVGHLGGVVGPVAIVTDTQIGPRYAKSCGPVDIVIEVPPGQPNKTLATVQHICEQLVEQGFDRSGTIIGLGGSVISGLAGFVSATYMRGVDLIHCPTSLLAMIDTAIGGKVGINLPQGKNLIGAFKQPKAVIADVATLQSLSPREFADGMAEVIKHGLIGGGELIEQIKNGSWKWDAWPQQPPLDVLQELVAQAIQVKIQIVQEDPFDEGRRALLNLGHTFAHAIEHASGHTTSHGEAVAVGLVAAANLSARLGHCGEDLQATVETVLTGADLPCRIPAAAEPDKILEAMQHDKKKRGPLLHMILLRGAGDAFVAEGVAPAAISETLADLTVVAS